MGGKWNRGEEALVVCSEKSMATGITVWDITTGDHLLHIPTCASHPHGLVLLCLKKNHFLFASQFHKHGSVGGGAIFMWTLNKPQTPLRSYTLEGIGPISCTKDGVYLSGGSPSGNIYIWEVASGKLLKSWRAHHRSLTCMLFSNDGSLLISGSDDGVICVWSMMSLLDKEDPGISSCLLHYLSKHSSSITGISTTSGSSSLVLVSSSLDGTCKVSDLLSGRVIKTIIFPVGITISILHPGEHIVYCGSLDGRTFVNKLDIGLIEDPNSSENQPIVLQGHNGAITALAYSQSGLVSASEDCTVCVWDDIHHTITMKFNHQKGPVTNLVLIPRFSLPSTSNNRRASNTFRVSQLEKYPRPYNSFNETITLLSKCHSSVPYPFQGTESTQQVLISKLEKEWTLEAMQMRVETNIEKRMLALKMAKHVMEINRHLQSRLLDLIQSRLLCSKEKENNSTNNNKTKKRKKLMVETSPCENNNGLPLQEDDQSKSPC